MIDKLQFLSSRGPVTAVRAWSAVAEPRAHALSRLEAQRIVDDLRREAARHTLVELSRMATGVEPLPSRTNSSTLISRIARAVEAGQLMFLDGWNLGDRRLPRAEGNQEADTPLTATAALVRRAMGARDEVVFEGQRYRLVTPTAPSQTPAGPGYRRVGEVEARALSQRMAERLPATPQERVAWAEVVAFLLKPPKDSALVLERWYVPAGGLTAPVDDRPVTTPAQLRAQVAPLQWVEIEIAYEDGTPFQGNCLVELPGGRSIQWSAGEDGILRVENLTPGDCKVRFPELDAQALKTA